MARRRQVILNSAARALCVAHNGFRLLTQFVFTLLHHSLVRPWYMGLGSIDRCLASSGNRFVDLISQILRKTSLEIVLLQQWFSHTIRWWSAINYASITASYRWLVSAVSNTVVVVEMRRWCQVSVITGHLTLPHDVWSVAIWQQVLNHSCLQVMAASQYVLLFLEALHHVSIMLWFLEVWCWCLKSFYSKSNALFVLRHKRCFHNKEEVHFFQNCN